MGVIDRIVELVVQFWRWITPVEIIDEYESGVVLRLGRYHRNATPGVLWKWPVIEATMTTNVVYETAHNYAQYLQTRDGKTVSVRLIVGYTIYDARAYLLTCEDAETVVCDAAMRSAAEIVEQTDFSEFQTSEINDRVLAVAKDAARRFGVDIETIGWLTKFGFDATLMTHHGGG